MIAYLLTAIGIVGIIISLMIEQSDYDPVSFGIATVSIIVAIIGLSMAFRVPPEDGQTRTGVSQAVSKEKPW